MLACWLRGVFDKETNVRGRDTHTLALWKLAPSQDIVFAMLSHAPERNNRRNTPIPNSSQWWVGLSPPSAQRYHPTSVPAKLDFEVKEGARLLLFRRCGIMNASSIFAIVTVASKNKRTTVSLSTVTDYCTCQCGEQCNVHIAIANIKNVHCESKPRLYFVCWLAT